MLLFDQNISFRIVQKLSTFFPDSQQVRALGLENASDKEIWQFAKLNNFSIVTFDSDFIDLAILNGCPPKIIWLRTGNKSTQNLADFILSKKELIHEFLLNINSDSIAFLELEDE